MPLTHELWRDSVQTSDATDMLDHARVEGPLDPVEVRDGKIQIRPFREHFFGHEEGPVFDSAQEKQYQAQTEIEVKQLIIDRLQKRRAELLTEHKKLFLDSAWEMRNKFARLQEELAAERATHAALSAQFNERANKFGRIRRYFSERYGALHLPTIALRVSTKKLEELTSSVKKASTHIARLNEIEPRMDAIKKEIEIIGIDSAYLQGQLNELLAAARKEGWVRDVRTRVAKSLQSPTQVTPGRKRTLRAGA